MLCEKQGYADLIISILDVMESNCIDLKKGSIRLDYSGRGMMGEDCLAICGSIYDAEKINKQTSENITFGVEGDWFDPSSIAVLQKWVKAAVSPEKDSLALDVVYYYPSVHIPHEYRDELNTIIKQNIEARS